ncbi:MAG: DUF3052 domain-containing protein [Austwickia sp.]|nr:DUF3052 domain-containing protein [Austwickia sp.]MBK8435171.1 DUF3052 domain-containing protein [Austwickia sp.]MBK9101275.1 DUF3052 domain-containing protein [Austwickia sp.]
MTWPPGLRTGACRLSSSPYACLQGHWETRASSTDSPGTTPSERCFLGAAVAGRLQTGCADAGLLRTLFGAAGRFLTLKEVTRVVATASHDSAVGKLGFAAGQVVMELGYDEDVDDELRGRIEEAIDGELEDEDFGDVVDAVLLWWRDDDGDLTDALVDALATLEDQGFIALLTPKVGRAGEVDPSDVAEAAETAGLHASASLNLTPQWSATRLVAPKTARR